MKASSVFRSPLFVKGADIGTTKTLAEADLNKCHQVTAGVVVTIPTPLTMKAQAGDMVMLFNSSAAGASVALGAGASFLNHSGSVPLTPGVAVLLVAYSDSAWTIQGIVPATQADIVAGTDVKKFINPKEHLSFHQADITKLAGIAAGANLYVHPNHSGDVTSVADGAQTIAANAVTNLKLADMANATIKGRVTAGAGDPEDLTAAQARSILNVADGAQKNSDITKAEIEAKLTGIISTHSHAAGNADTVDGYHAQKTAAADKIPVSGSDGVLADGWLPTRLGTVCKTITDWNAATETGWYMGSYTTANAPGADWMMGEVIKHNDGWICQRVCRFAIDGVWFVRYLKGGVWSAWVHLVTEPSHIHWYAVPKDAGFNGVGSFCWGRNNSSSNIAAGGTLDGSSISAMGLLPNVNTDGSSLNMGSGGTLAGTWRCLGLGYKNYTTLWQRIA